jgi:hypothetical protein
MRLDGTNPIPNPLAAGRFQLSPLLTALRYSREGILEMGAPVFSPFLPAPVVARCARALWTGMAVYLERNGLGFVIGRDVLAVPTEPPDAVRALMDEHGLPPDLETETRPGFRAWEFARASGPRPMATESEPLRFWPPGLQEALLRGCRLACEPAYDNSAGSLEFVWVASRDMLDERGDWVSPNPCGPRPEASPRWGS